MHRCGERFPAGVSVLAGVGLQPLPSRQVRPPRIANAPFECTLHELLETPSRQIFIGQARFAARPDQDGLSRILLPEGRTYPRKSPSARGLYFFTCAFRMTAGQPRSLKGSKNFT